MTLHRTGPTAVGRTDATVPKLPMAALPALATTVFVTSLTETLPAGLLPDPLAAGIARAYNTRIHKVVTVGGHKVRRARLNPGPNAHPLD